MLIFCSPPMLFYYRRAIFRNLSLSRNTHNMFHICSYGTGVLLAESYFSRHWHDKLEKTFEEFGLSVPSEAFHHRLHQACNLQVQSPTDNLWKRQFGLNSVKCHIAANEYAEEQCLALDENGQQKRAEGVVPAGIGFGAAFAASLHPKIINTEVNAKLLKSNPKSYYAFMIFVGMFVMYKYVERKYIGYYHEWFYLNKMIPFEYAEATKVEQMEQTDFTDSIIEKHVLKTDELSELGLVEVAPTPIDHVKEADFRIDNHFAAKSTQSSQVAEKSTTQTIWKTWDEAKSS